MLARLEELTAPFLNAVIDASEFEMRLGFCVSQLVDRGAAVGVSDRVGATWHEAGHAVAAHVKGALVTHVTLVGEGPPLSLGHVRYHPLSGSSAETHCMITLAGPLAEGMATGPIPTERMEAHRRQCNEFLMDGRPDMSTAVRLGYLRVFEMAALEIVQRYWPHVTRVAEALAREDTLTREAFLAAFEDPPPPDAESLA